MARIEGVASKSALEQFAGSLRELQRAAGSPSGPQLVKKLQPGALNTSTISDVLRARSRPRWEFVAAFIDACRKHATSNKIAVDPALVDLGRWRQRHDVLMQVLEQLDRVAIPTLGDDWTLQAEHSTIWHHVSSARDSAFFRKQVALTVGTLARLRDSALKEQPSDPWHDSGLPARLLERIEWLLGEPDKEHSLDLYPAEAALLVVVPFLYYTHYRRSVARYSRLDPATLTKVSEPGTDRSSFEAFIDLYDLLTKRALMRPEAMAAIGWWLFHRWLSHREIHTDTPNIRETLDLIGSPISEMGETFAPLRVARLIHGMRRGPDVCNPEFLDVLQADEHIRAPGQQRIRERRLVLLITLAYGVAVDMTALPSIIAEHLGIPHAIDLNELNRTLGTLTWGGPPELPVLRAECHHEAVIEGLKEYTVRVDELLHRVDRTARERITQPMPPLPKRLSSDGVVPADGVFDGWASFRLDERRIRDLLMGVQLYKDRDLAVREMYQNSLDACRYRQARTEYLNRTGSAVYTYEGKIEFQQAVDEEGRVYLECRDNGIGMGDAELRGVFSNAGARFTEQPDFKTERSAWARLNPPIELFPNSRFGIGVLSYFMLADEIRVTTCRMSATGDLGPMLEVSIFGPGHLFRVVTLAERGDESGTRVRVYLRDEPEQISKWSAISALERVLGVAEFATSVRHEDWCVDWPVGDLRPREQSLGERFGLNAYGVLIPWQSPPEGVQVFWCQEGGALLVDGLVVQPSVRRGVLSSTNSGLSGVVVNLSRKFAPAQLTADRSQVLDDLSETLRSLLTPAADDLLSLNTLLPDFEWLCRVADGSVHLADLLTESAVRAARKLKCGETELDVSRTGFFPADAEILGLRLPHRSDEALWKTYDDVPDHIFLWRLLASRPNKLLAELAGYCPELDEIEPSVIAKPSDHLLLAHRSRRGDYWSWIDERQEVHRFSDAVEFLQIAPRVASVRAADLGIHNLRYEAFPEFVGHDQSELTLLQDSRGAFVRAGQEVTVTDLMDASTYTKRPAIEVAQAWRRAGVEVSEAVLSLTVAAEADELLLIDPDHKNAGWFNVGDRVPAGRVAQASRLLGLSVSEVCARFNGYGLQTDARGLPDLPSDETVLMLRCVIGRGQPWLERDEPLPPAQVLAVAKELGLDPPIVLERLSQLEFPVPAIFPGDATIEDLGLLTYPSKSGDGVVLYPPGPYPYRLLFEALSDDRPLHSAVARLKDYGFDIPIQVAEDLSPLEDELFWRGSPCSWWEVTTDDVLPFAHLVVASRDLHVSPDELAQCLIQCGIQVSAAELPSDLTFTDAVDLLRRDRYEEDYFAAESNLSMQQVIKIARSRNTTIDQIVLWFSQLGIRVPDIELTLREALSRIRVRPLGRTS